MESVIKMTLISLEFGKKFWKVNAYRKNRINAFLGRIMLNDYYWTGDDDKIPMNMQAICNIYIS